MMRCRIYATRVVMLAFLGAMLAAGAACGPAAPAGQGGATGDAVEVAATGTPTPEPTAIAETTSTPAPEPTAIAETTGTPTPEPTAIAETTGTPTPEPTAIAETTGTPTPEPTAIAETTGTPTPEPTAIAETTGTPTPEPTPTLFLINNGTPWALEHPPECVQDNPKLDYWLFYLALLHEAAQSGLQEVCGHTAQLVAEVEVLITPDGEESIPAIVQFLKDNGASLTYAYMDLPNDGYGHYQLGATLPASLLVRLSEQPGVVIVEHPAIPEELNAPSAP